MSLPDLPENRPEQQLAMPILLAFHDHLPQNFLEDAGMNVIALAM